jgi:predicted lipoprotein with Yx(FWY)xxD motif
MANFRGMRWSARLGALTGLALAAMLALAACGGAGGAGGLYGGTTSTTGGGSSVAVNLQCASGAKVCTKTVNVSGKSQTALADTSGMTLYYFTPDSATTIACTGSCAQNWPPLTTTSGSVTGTGLSGSLTAFNGADGEQVEYNGHPLYRYSGDQSQSDATGEGILGKWFVATPSLAAGSGASSPTKSPGGGYGSGY